MTFRYSFIFLFFASHSHEVLAATHFSISTNLMRMRTIQQVNSPHNNPDPIQRSPLAPLLYSSLSNSLYLPPQPSSQISNSLCHTAQESFNPDIGSENRVSYACSAWGNDSGNHTEVSWQDTNQGRSEIGTRETGIQICRRENASSWGFVGNKPHFK